MRFKNYLNEAKMKMEFKDKDHEKKFKIIYDAKKKSIEKEESGEISEPMMVNVKGRGIKFPGFQTSYKNRNGKMINKMWAIDERGYDIYV